MDEGISTARMHGNGVQENRSRVSFSAPRFAATQLIIHHLRFRDAGCSSGWWMSLYRVNQESG